MEPGRRIYSGMFLLSGNARRFPSESRRKGSARDRRRLYGCHSRCCRSGNRRLDRLDVRRSARRQETTPKAVEDLGNGTIFEKSSTSLQLWFYAIYLIT